MPITLDCSVLDQMPHYVDLVRSCDVVRSGALRISTPFAYPNGDHVDVFLYSRPSSLFNEIHVSDYGQTYTYLRGAQVGLFGTTRKREVVRDITAQLNVKIESGELFVSIRGEDKQSFSDAILRIAQACVRISDLATHQRLRSSNPFRDDVEDFFEAKNFAYLRDVKVLNRYGTPRRMDFEVTTSNARSYVNVLAAMNPTAVHQAANEIFVKLYDLTHMKEAGHQFITVYNSASRAIRGNDVRLLGELSEVVPYPEGQELLERILEAA